MRKKTKPPIHITTTAHRYRIGFILFIFIFSFARLVLRLYQVQCLQHEEHLIKAIKITTTKPTIPAKRGTIFDRNGNELAVSIDYYNVICSPQAIAQVKKSQDKRKKDIDTKLTKALAPILHLPEKQVLSTFLSDTNLQRVILKKEIDIATKLQIDAIRAKYYIQNEVDFETVSKRLYPKAELACHIIGPAGIGYHDTTYNTCGENRGLFGIELRQQNQLGGTYTRASCLRDRWGRPLTPLDYTLLLSVKGNQLYLTIDETIQHAAERELKSAVEQFKAVGGCIIVMDPFTGEILALANEPNFDLNRYGEIAKDREFWQRVSRNEAVEKVIEPGSTAKIFTAAAALEEDAVKLTDKFYGYKGKIIFCNRTLRDAHPYEWLTFPQVIELSSNIGIHQVAQRMSPATLRKYLTEFGFGNRSGVELPGEAYGLVPSLSEWTPLTMSRISFGQSISMSPLQLTCAVAAIANGGILMKPHIIKAVYDAQGIKIKESVPEQVRRVISYSTATTLTAIMEGVVERGTGKAAQLESFRVAGKTGTAQVVLENAKGYKSGKYNSSFVGFVPAEAPRVVITVILNEPCGGLYYGGTVATPPFKAVAKEALTQLKVHPSLLPRMPATKTYPEQIVKLDEKEIPKSKFESRNPKSETDSIPQLPLPSSNQVAPGISIPGLPSIQDVAVRLVTFRDTPSENTIMPASYSMPDVRGLTKRKVTLLLASRKLSGLKVRFVGSGIAIDQTPVPGKEIQIGDQCLIRFGTNRLN